MIYPTELIFLHLFIHPIFNSLTHLCLLKGTYIIRMREIRILNIISYDWRLDSKQDSRRRNRETRHRSNPDGRSGRKRTERCIERSTCVACVVPSRLKRSKRSSVAVEKRGSQTRTSTIDLCARARDPRVYIRPRLDVILLIDISEESVAIVERGRERSGPLLNGSNIAALG